MWLLALMLLMLIVVIPQAVQGSRRRREARAIEILHCGGVMDMPTFRRQLYPNLDDRTQLRKTKAMFDRLHAKGFIRDGWDDTRKIADFSLSAAGQREYYRRHRVGH